MLIAATNMRIEIRYMGFWKIVDSKAMDNWGNVDFTYVLKQLGVDVFDGKGWEQNDSDSVSVKMAVSYRTYIKALFISMP